MPSLNCRRQDLNLHCQLWQPGPQPGASANSATPAGGAYLAYGGKPEQTRRPVDQKRQGDEEKVRHGVARGERGVKPRSATTCETRRSPARPRVRLLFLVSTVYCLLLPSRRKRSLGRGFEAVPEGAERV